MFWELWIFGSLGNAADYFSTVYIMENVRKIRPSTKPLDHELNPLPKWLFKTFGFYRLFPLFQVGIFLLYVFNPVETGAYLLTGLLGMAGYYSLITAANVYERLKLVQVIDDEIPVIEWE